ncbi:MAG: hypothetical protein LBP35_07195 [Candidatus Ancillula trichonymphae]|nr:hypothetical protein [Candidatus Ancillula trichonymphae]
MKKQVFFRRRLVFLAAMLFAALVLVNLGKLAVAGVHALTSGASKQQQTAASASASAAGVSEAAEDGLVPDCTANDLSVQIDMPKDSFSQQEGLHLLVKTEYYGQTRCSLKTSTDNRTLLVRLGNLDFYNSQNCKVEDAGVVLSKSEVSTQEVTWNMRANGDDHCSSGQLATPGYYTTQLVFASPAGLATNSVIFRVV